MFDKIVMSLKTNDSVSREKEELVSQLQPAAASVTERSPVEPVFTNQFFGEVQQSSAASFFEDLGGANVHPTITQPEHQLQAVPAVDPDELNNLREELRLKVASSEQLSVELNDVKTQLQVKLLELAELEAKSEQLRQSSLVTSEENHSLRSEVSELQQRLTVQEVPDITDPAASLFTEPPAQAATDTFEAQPASAASFFSEVPDEAGQEAASTASLFTQDSAASFFTEAAAQGQTQSAASLFSEEPSTAMEAASEALPAVEELSPEQMMANLGWYQSQLCQYQQACQDWTVWGDEKTREIRELNEHLSYQTEAFRIKAAETEKLKEKLQEQEESDKRNDQSMVKLKDLEIIDMKESLERLESEKSELEEEITEMRNTIAELRSVSETVESYRDDQADLLDTRTRLEEVERERAKMFSDLSDLRNEMATIQFSSDKAIKDLRKDLDDKIHEIEQLNAEKAELQSKADELEKSLEEEKKMQEEIGDEYESMQRQVQDSAVRVSELQDELDSVKAQVSDENVDEKMKELRSELEQYQQTCTDWNTWAEARNTEYQQLLEAYNGYVEAYNNLQAQHQPAESLEEVASKQLESKTEELQQLEEKYKKSLQDHEELVSEAKLTEECYESCLQDQEQLERKLVEAKSSVEETEERYQSCIQEQKQLEEKLVEANCSIEKMEERYQVCLLQHQQASAAAEERERLLKSDIESSQKQITELQQSLESSTSKEGPLEPPRTAEYESLLEAYNQYAVAYDYLNTEYAKLQAQLQQSSQTPAVDQLSVEALQVQLQERDTEILSLKQEVESKEKELVEKTATVAKMSISSALAGPMSLAVDEAEGWGGLETSEVQQASASQDVLLLEGEISELRGKLRAAEEEKRKALEDLNAAKLKSGKLLVKVKQLTKEVEGLKKAGKPAGGLDDLDRALQDEMKLQAEKTQHELKEVTKEMESLRSERTNLVRKVETLESGNERLVELKESQDNEVEFLQHKIRELTSKVDAQQWEMTELIEQRETEVADLRGQLEVLTSGSESGEGEARLEVAALTSQLTAARQETDRLSSDVAVLSQSLVAAQTEAATVKSQAIDLQDSIDRLAGEREDLLAENQTLKSSFSSAASTGGAYEEIVKLNNSLNAEIASLKQYVKSGSPTVASPEPVREVEQLRDAVRREQQLVVQLERDLQVKEEGLRSLEEELFLARDWKLKKEEELRGRRDSARDSQSLDREVFAVFSDKNLVLENVRLKTDLDNVSRERRQLSERISRWEEELGRDDIDTMGEDGLRQELRVAIKTLQLRDHK